MGHPTRDGVVALDKASGDVVWHELFDANHQGMIMHGSTLIAALYLGSSESTTRITALHEDGKVTWSHNSIDDLGVTTRDLASVGSKHLLMLQGSTLTVLDADTGDELWNTQGHNLALDGEEVLIARDGHLDVANVVTGEVSWRYELPRVDRSTSLHATLLDGNAFLCDSGRVVRVEIASGHQSHIDCADLGAIDDMWAISSTLVILEGENQAAIFDVTGERQWGIQDQQLFKSITVGSTVSLAEFSLHGLDLTLYDAQSGAVGLNLRDRNRTLGAFGSSAVLVEGVGSVKAYSLEDGHEMWELNHLGVEAGQDLGAEMWLLDSAIAIFHSGCLEYFR